MPRSEDPTLPRDGTDLITVIGVIHVGALPGTPGNTQTVAELITTAKREAKLYRESNHQSLKHFPGLDSLQDIKHLGNE